MEICFENCPLCSQPELKIVNLLTAQINLVSRLNPALMVFDHQDRTHFLTYTCEHTHTGIMCQGGINDFPLPSFVPSLCCLKCSAILLVFIISGVSQNTHSAFLQAVNSSTPAWLCSDKTSSVCMWVFVYARESLSQNREHNVQQGPHVCLSFCFLRPSFIKCASDRKEKNGCMLIFMQRSAFINLARGEGMFKSYARSEFVCSVLSEKSVVQWIKSVWLWIVGSYKCPAFSDKQTDIHRLF